uniref:TolB family protein n=1 Tax=Armatimonas sp. TaxID=1872638 RepID=UPI00286B6957
TDLDIPGGPRWAPSGNGLVISSYRTISSGSGGSTRRSAILRVGLDGSSEEIKPNIQPELPGFEPDVSPNGGKIAFTGVSGGSFKIWTMDLDGGNPQKIEAVNWQSGPRFSPDGKQIVFQQHRSSGTRKDLYIASADGSEARMLASSPTASNPASPSWSPDGKRIVYAMNGGFYSIKTDGSDNTQLFPNLGAPATLGEINWK